MGGIEGGGALYYTPRHGLLGPERISYTISDAAGAEDTADVVINVKAFDISWDGEGDGVSWQDARNWSGDVLPDVSSDVTIDSAGAAVDHAGAETFSQVANDSM